MNRFRRRPRNLGGNCLKNIWAYRNIREMPNYALHLTSNQREQDRADQVENSAGGYVFALTPLKQLERFLILGCEGGTYYASERKLTRENATCVVACLDAEGLKAVELIAAVSESGRAPKQDACIFALAVAAAHSSEIVRKAALGNLSRVCRIGTDLFHFIQTVKTLRGFGSALRNAIASWYNEKDLSKLEYQVCKYAQRDGMSHRDVLRLAHPTTSDVRRNALYRWMVGANGFPRELPAFKGKKARAYPYAESPSAYILDFEALKKADVPSAIKLIEKNKFTHDMVPSELKANADVWNALLPHMPLGALTRNLATLTRLGVVAPMNAGLATVIGKFNKAAIIKARLHPIKILAALRTYQQGHGEKGKHTWSPVPQLVDCLNEAFYDAFDAIEPSGARTLVALDISGSMGGPAIAGIPGLSPREASAAMAMVTMRKEKLWAVLGFSHQLIPLDISPSMRLDDVQRRISNLPFGNTDCSLPMLSALQKKAEVDVFYVLTDNETYYVNIHPYQALKAYRQKMGIPAKLAVCAMSASQFSICDPKDAGSMDIVGFDTSTPALLADFSRPE